MSDKDARHPINSGRALGRRQILDATSRCMQRWGYEATTIRRIAAELGCAVGSIYRYFRDKTDLFYAVAQRPLEQVAVLAEAGGGIEHCERLYLDQVRNCPQLYRLMFWLACVVDDSPPLASGPMPAVIGRIIDAWARELADRTLAQNRWAQIHVAAILGDPAAIQGPAAHVAQIATPISTTAPSQDAADPGQVLEPDPVEDVCLL